MHGYMNVK